MKEILKGQPMTYRMGSRIFDAESRYLTLQLTDSTHLRDDPAALQERIERDGYLYLRDFHDPGAVRSARTSIVQRLAARGELATHTDLEDAIANPTVSDKATSSVRGNDDLKTAELRALLYSDRTRGFFRRFLGGDPLGYRFQWLRAAGPGAGSPIHADLPYMGRGTLNVYTLWTPLGTITPEMGPLALCLGSHLWSSVRRKYAVLDVDRDRFGGVFSEDPADLVDRLGGRWATTTFEPGDAVILGMHLLHGSLANSSDRFRISCDTRFQRSDEPMDDRWAGDTPAGHEYLWSPSPTLVPVSEAKTWWDQ